MNAYIFEALVDLTVKSAEACQRCTVTGPHVLSFGGLSGWGIKDRLGAGHLSAVDDQSLARDK